MTILTPRRYFLSVLALLLTSCATGPKSPPAPPTPAAFTPEAFVLEDAADLLLYRAGQMYTLQADINIRMGRPGTETATHTDAVLGYHAPDQLYIRGYNKFIPNVFTIVIREDRFWFHVPKDNVVFTGTRTSLMKRSEIQLELNGFDILSGLISAPLLSRKGHQRAREDDFYVINDYAPSASPDSRPLVRRLWLNAHTLDVERELHYTPDSIQYLEITRTEFYEERGWRRPRFITLNRLREQRSTVILFWNVKINTPVSPAIFEFQIPENARVEEI